MKRVFFCMIMLVLLLAAAAAEERPPMIALTLQSYLFYDWSVCRNDA